MDQFPIHTLGRALIVIGGIIVVVGVIILVAGKIPFLGRLPGDINIRGKNWSFHFPLVTSIILSIVLTVILNMIFRK
jgi:uncharacterized membrane protein YidH (DUF202 family)